MAQPTMQYSFNSGEWAPALNARVDIAKYHSGAALLRNFFVDYRGGASTRTGTRFIQQTKLNTTTRLISFQASFTVAYVLEFGNNYIRFYNNGAPVLEAAKTITGITQANPGVITSASHGYSNGDWIYPAAIVGMIQLNANGPYIVAGATANTYTLTNLSGNAISTLAFGAYVSGGTTQRVYTLTGSPYLASELAQIKFTQNVNVLIICHPNHPPYQLTLNSATNWTIGQITFGSTIAAPTGLGATTTLAAGTVFYGVVVTAIDFNGQESAPSSPLFQGPLTDLRTTPGTNTYSWSAVSGAASYNVYKAEPRYSSNPPVGAPYGFIGNVTGIALADSNIAPDFSSGPPVIQNPFSGGSVQSVAVTSTGSYTNGQAIPTISFTGGGGTGATAYASALPATVAIVNAGTGIVGDIYNFASGLSIIVTTTSGPTVTGIAVNSSGTILSGGTTPISGAAPVSWSTAHGIDQGLRISSTWAVNTITLTNPGAAYTSTPTVVVSNGAAAGVATLTPAGSGPPNFGNPTIPALFQQRLFLAGPLGNPQYFTFSQTGAYYNFNVNSPIEADNAIIGNLVSGQLNSIQSAIPMPQGLIIFSDKQAWLMNGGSPGSAISPIQLVANSQAYNGASFPPPIVANDNILYIQSKGSIVRDLVFNFYTQVYTGTDISVLSSHLFYGFSILEWAWAEEPFKIVWAVRNDGTLLSLTFLKEQELVAWAHSDTTNGLFKSIATVTEQTSTAGAVDAVYTVVQRVINGATVQFVERFAERIYTNGVVDAWTVDAGIQYVGTATANFTGAAYLAGQTVTGLADGVAITPFVMPANGAFTLVTPASKVTIGLGFTAQLQTLAIDLGEPTVQGKRKVIPAVTVRVKDALGLSIGGDFSSLVAMKDLVVGNVGSASNTVVADLVTNDARTLLNSTYTVAGQYCIQQSLPYPASILGVIPEISVGDTAK